MDIQESFGKCGIINMLLYIMMYVKIVVLHFIKSNVGKITPYSFMTTYCS